MKTIGKALAIAALGYLANPVASMAEPAFPTQPVTIVVPYSAGGGTDAIARTIAQALSEKWKESVVVDNRTGAEGVIGTQRVLHQPADGHTLLIQLNSMLLYEWLHQSSNIDVMKDLEPISKIQESPLVITVSSSNPANTLQELFENCKKSANCSYGTATSNGKLVGHQIADIAGAEMVAIPYKGTSPMVNDLLGGHLGIAMLSANLAVPMRKDGKVKALAVGTKERFKDLEDVPTFKEASGQEINGTTWYGLFAKAGTPADILQRIEKDLADISRNEKIRAAIAAQGAKPIFNTASQFKEDIRQEHEEISAAANKFL